MDIILASNSPRRKEILEKAGYTLKVVPSNYDEKTCGLAYSTKLIENCAYQKACEVSKDYKDKLVVGADTVVVFGGAIYGKPTCKFEAFNMLQSLSNKTHFVATSICLIKGDKVLKATEKTSVTFRKLADMEILNYIKTKNPFDKAGSYGIQDEGFDFAIKVTSPLDNVIGFPLGLFEKMLAMI